MSENQTENPEELITAFVVVGRPVVLPYIEGTITKETGPWIPDDANTKAYGEALIQMANRGELRVVQVPRSQVKIIGAGFGHDVTRVAGTSGGGAKLKLDQGVVRDAGGPSLGFVKVI